MEPNRECPRFHHCSVNNCPLDSGYPDYDTSPLDKERRCTLGKTVRLRIAAKYPGELKYGGKTLAGLRAEKSWNSRSLESRKKNTKQLAEQRRKWRRERNPVANDSK